MSNEIDVPENAQISVVSVREPSLANPETDPFSKFKKNPEKFHYRALNIKTHNLRTKEASGYQTVSGSEFGDLVLARIPKEIYEARQKKREKKSEDRGKAIKDSFQDQTNRYAKHGLKAEE